MSWEIVEEGDGVIAKFSQINLLMHKKQLIVFGGLVTAILVSLVLGYFGSTFGNRASVEQERPMDQLVGILYGRFDQRQPGFGITDYPGHTEAHVPKSYAKILLAELERNRNGMRPDLPNLGPAAGRWLLDNADLDNDGVVGWGVPIAWDAYGDGSENPADTTYTISTAIVVDALLDWMEQDPRSPGSEILSMVEAALRPFSDPEMRSPSGLAPYSFVSSDMQYDTFNPAAYLAGQLQRFSRITKDAGLADGLRVAADATVQALIAHRKVNPKTGSWYWHYSVQEDVTNDLPHASYIVHGLSEYARFGGAFADELDIEAAVDHLNEFEQEPTNEFMGYIRGWPLLQENIDRAARTYDIGMAMSLICELDQTSQLPQRLARELEKYRTKEGAYLKYPVGSDFVEPIVVNEYDAYLYQGAVACATLESRQLQSDAISVRLSDKASFRTRPNSTENSIPFVRPFSGKGVVTALDTPPSFVASSDKATLHFSASELPLAVFEVEGSHLSVVRTMPDDGLNLKQLAPNGLVIATLPLAVSAGTQPMLRAARMHDDVLSIILYDNVEQRNFLAQYKLELGSIVEIMKPLALPLLLDPAGGTYEMIPWVDILSFEGSLHIVGGTLNAQLTSGGIVEERWPDCLKVIEAVATSKGPAILCLAPESADVPYVILAPDGIDVPELEIGAVPYKLEFSDGRLIVKHAHNTDNYREMLVYDLERVQQNGWLEFGISNTEGRIPWSQIYYLNGFLDLLYVAERNEKIAEVMETLAPEVRHRLDLEISLVDQHWTEGRYATRAFTVDRSLSLFAVQTSRLLLLMNRYLQEQSSPISISGYRPLVRAVHCLENHIEVLAYGEEPAHWLSGEGANLKWPKGSKFYFDGVAVPYNHQNEWAYSVLRTPAVAECPDAARAATDIIELFQRRIAPNGNMPNSGTWDYWWGTAYDGWKPDDRVSENMVEYHGDHIKAWISFRSIDAMSNLAASDRLPARVRENLIASTRNLVSAGKLYPFVNFELTQHEESAVLFRSVALRYARMNSAWDLQSAVWAYLALVNDSD